MEKIAELLNVFGERLERQEQAIRLLAQTIEDGSWNGLPLEIDRILYPNKPEGAE